MLAKRLVELREEKSMTRKELACYLKIDQSTYGKYELGKRQPDYETLLKLAIFYGVTTDYLLGRNNIRNPESEIKAGHNLNIYGLPQEAISQVKDYIELIRHKYLPNATSEQEKKK